MQRHRETERQRDREREGERNTEREEGVFRGVRVGEREVIKESRVLSMDPGVFAGDRAVVPLVP